MRRTFISLARADGARKDVLEWVTHGPRGNIVDLYTTLPWELLCEEVSKLRIDLRTGQVIAFPKAMARGASSDPGDGGSRGPKEDDRVALLHAVTTLGQPILEELDFGQQIR